MRTISEIETRSIKSATESSYLLGGGVTAFPDLTRVGVSTLSKYASFNDEFKENVIPCDVAIEADRRAKSPIIVAAMARLLGYRLVRDTEDAPVRAATLDDVMTVFTEHADVLREARKALLDGKVDEADRKIVVPEIDEAMRALQHLRDGFVGGAG